jgi:hypothetical protein
MGIAYFDGDQISHGSYVVLKGSNQPTVITYPRTVGGIIQESGVVEKELELRSYLIPPVGSKREDLEDYFHSLNEKIGSKEADLEVNGNTYLNANVKNIDYDNVIVNNFTRFSVNFELNNQDEDGEIRQLTVPGLLGFTRGRKMKFVTQMEDGEDKTFHFWHNFDLIKNFETEITLKRGTEIDGSVTGKVIRVGGFEKNICYGWVLGPETNTRRNLEAYAYNIINGPLGRLGTLYVDGENRVITNCVLTNFIMEDSTALGIKYELTFFSSLQC